ncbi:Aste57867_25311 [Aphanomyces stellatus]|uniref:Aste57867_25311 protein n=1 Tax=Aphanomyces stellatus TaxID=120398 RepID=A0A485LXH3_9STRA|nr:hypothetical protein As57867_025233 [Aphanomyces stellatus]VFU01936.1 Aste57867_25311 [Aphanomyces stellatus]
MYLFVIAVTTALTHAALAPNATNCTADDNTAAAAALQVVWPNCSTTGANILSLIPNDPTKVAAWCASTCPANLAAVGAVLPNCVNPGTPPSNQVIEFTTKFASTCAPAVAGGPCNLTQQLSGLAIGAQPAPAKCLAAAELPATTNTSEWTGTFKSSYCNLPDCLAALETVNASMPNCLVNGAALFPTPCPANWTKSTSPTTPASGAKNSAAATCLVGVASVTAATLALVF